MKSLSRQAIEEFRSIYKQLNNVELSEKQAQEMGLDLLRFMKAITKQKPVNGNLNMTH